ncbi:hypothetical protein [Loktanella sp. SALINAS62]|uniref:hypothetical protein n=1 Tax=Loktanella sp. SALINAS62 TaxID=2706124 RepID=UPI001B8C03F4|nr:hypothetical protein [Loktanella sp. SALINAS62]MBS1302511.1 hypothetical protein [Loktanella sp. SALINAS62]
MSRDVNLYSQVVGWLKILLPLGALVLLSTLFLIARGGPGVDDIPFAQIDAVATEQRIGAPRFTGLTDAGDAVEFSATQAQPSQNAADVVDVSRPQLAMHAPDGTALRLTAGKGTMDTAGQIATLTGLARLEISTGYTMETAGLNADLTSGTVVSDGALEIRAPFGDLTAGQAKVVLGQSSNGAQLHFSDGVRLLFVPQTAED